MTDTPHPLHLAGTICQYRATLSPEEWRTDDPGARSQLAADLVVVADEAAGAFDDELVSDLYRLAALIAVASPTTVELDDLDVLLEEAATTLLDLHAQFRAVTSVN